MGVLQDFERRLEGAVEGFFARTFRSGLQPIELAKGLQRYARDTRHVAHDGVVVPNVYRFTVNPGDDARLRGSGMDLETELARVVVETAQEENWVLRGNTLVLLEASDDVRVGRFDLAGRIEPTPGPDVDDVAGEDHDEGPVDAAMDGDVPGEDDAPPPAPSRARRDEPGHTSVFAPSEGDPGSDARAALRVVSGGDPRVVRLTARTVAGRSPGTQLVLSDTSVSREHAAFVRRDGTWWVVDLGSTNGTAVNDRQAAEHALHDGDRVRLGEAVLEFVES